MKERFARFSSFWIFPLLSIVLLITGHRVEPLKPVSRLFWLLPVGLASWTLLEYIFHRIFLHKVALVSESHRLHHLDPRNGALILVPPVYALLISAGLFGILLLSIRSLFDVAGITTGIWLGFLYYETVHYRVHMSLANSRLLQHHRRAHFYHHFSHVDRCFGVTSSIWDRILGTGRKSQ